MVTRCHREVFILLCCSVHSIYLSLLSILSLVPPPRNTGGIERFSAKENFQKILKVSHFYLGFSANKNNDEIKHSQRVSLDLLGQNEKNSN